VTAADQQPTIAELARHNQELTSALIAAEQRAREAEARVKLLVPVCEDYKADLAAAESENVRLKVEVQERGEASVRLASENAHMRVEIAAKDQEIVAAWHERKRLQAEVARLKAEQEELGQELTRMLAVVDASVDFDRVETGVCSRCGDKATVRLTFSDPEPNSPATLLACSVCYRAFGLLVLGAKGPAASLLDRLDR
jgi:chorismate mutase